jgi:four helix bundle protein
MSGLKDLIVWRRSIELVVACYRIAASLPREELYGLTTQLRRAAVSVAANIAEGNGRDSPSQYLHFIAIARGSLQEVVTYLAVVQELKYVTESQAAVANRLADEVSRMLTGMRKGLLKRREQLGLRP